MNPFLFAFIIFLLATTSSFIVADFSKFTKPVGILGILGLGAFLIWSINTLGWMHGLGGLVLAVIVFSSASSTHDK